MQARWRRARTVLVVDDDRSYRAMIGQVLEALGATVSMLHDPAASTA